MQAEIMIALIGLGGSVIGSFGGILVSAKLTTYRLAQFEKKVDKHNSVVERTFILEEQMKVTKHRLNDLEENEKVRN